MGDSTTRRFTAAAVMAGAIALSGCSPTPAGSAAEATVSMTESGTPSETAGPSITGGKVIQTDKGEYLRSIITDDDPAMQYDPSVVLPGTLDYVPADQVKAGWKFAVRFVAEEFLDSPLNNHADSVDAWWDDHKDDFDPAYQESIRKEFDQGNESGPVLRLRSDDGGLQYVHSPRETRLSDRSIKVEEVYYSDNGMLVFKISFSATIKATTPEGESASETIEDGEYLFGLIPSETNGHGWAISHYDASYKYGNLD